MRLFDDIYRGKTVLITGHAGFKGTWLACWLKKLGARVVGYSLVPDTPETLYAHLDLPSMIDADRIADIGDNNSLCDFIAEHRPQIVFHLAAQALVRQSYYDPVTTWETNVLGTLRVLEAARHCGSVQAVVNVTTDKCYENLEIRRDYVETDRLGGYDMYSASKACSEILTNAYRRSFLADESGMAVATARAGNVIGGGDWSADRLVPDCIGSLCRNETIILRYPEATRPWQFVLDPLAGYLRLGQLLLADGKKFAKAYNFGPEPGHAVEVLELTQMIIRRWGSGRCEVVPDERLHEATLLQLDITRAREELGFSPIYNVERAVEDTVDWYKSRYTGNNIRDLTERQIDRFVTTAADKHVLWTH